MTRSLVSMSLEEAFRRAVAHHVAGEAEEAEGGYRAILQVAPDHAVVWYHLGVLLAQNGHADAGLPCLLAALERDPLEDRYWRACLEALMEVAAAEAELVDALRRMPMDPGLHYRLAMGFLEQGRHTEAVGVFKRLTALAPAVAEVWNDLGVALSALRRHEEAEAAYGQALVLAPGHALSGFNRGNLRKVVGRPAEAEADYRRALSAQPDFADAWNNLGNLLKEQNRFAEAEECLRRALSHQPEYRQARLNLGLLLAESNRCSEARACFETLLAMDGNHAEARWHMAMLPLAPFRERQEEKGLVKEAFARELEALWEWFSVREWRFGEQAVGCGQPFFLAYHEEDHLPLLSRYGDLCVRLMARWSGGIPLLSPAPRPAGPIRVGVVSGYFRDHSVWQAILKGFFLHLDRSRFQLFAFCTGSHLDEESRLAMALSEFFATPRSLGEWVDQIRAMRPDVLLYPELGMDPMTFKLACLRLAPVQMAAWGHPETSGLPTMDCFLSGEMLEPGNGAANYREKLLKLPNLGVCVGRMSAGAGQDVDGSAFGLRPQDPILVCAGTPFKYDPACDGIFVELARRIEGCQLVFFIPSGRPELSRPLQDRLEQRLRSAGLEPAMHLFFLPWLPGEAFHGLMRHATLMLDTIGFSGFNTVLRAVECLLPVVTLEGRFLRGRLGAGILRRLGVTETIAGGIGEYVELAVRLTHDASWRQAIRERMAVNLPCLFEDPLPVRRLEELLKHMVPG
ncbi:MAG: tetratricopeptide repeat protein [Magnetococcales bacterium]|nr:tetratricopeptide repeat protein [Magnetococcales bacterium]